MAVRILSHGHHSLLPALQGNFIVAHGANRCNSISIGQSIKFIVDIEVIICRVFLLRTMSFT